MVLLPPPGELADSPQTCPSSSKTGLHQLNLSNMGFLVVLESGNHLQEEPRPKLVHQSPCRREKVDEKDIKGLLKGKYYNLTTVDGDPTELKLHSSTNPNRRSMPARPHTVKSKTTESLKRASVYQSSRESRSMRKRDGRRNVEPAIRDDTFLSFDIIDPSPHVSFSTESTAPTAEFLELSFRDIPNECFKPLSACSNSSPVLNNGEDDFLEFNSDKNKISDIETNSNLLSERDNMYNLPKSLSAKAVMSNSLCQSGRETSKASPKSRFTQFKKILNPILKSKSLRNPTLMEIETSDSTAVNSPGVKRHRVFRKSLLSDFTKVAEKMDFDEVSVTVSSPAHLHADVKLESRNGTPSYEFALKDPEDVLFAKTWRSDSAFNWVYTFHRCKKKSKDKHGQSSPMVGQMQVLCYLCSEVNVTGSIEISIVTEFVLYDIALARRSFAMDEESQRSSDFTVGDSSVAESSNDFDSDPSSSYPWARADLYPHLEIASIVIQVPFSKNEMKDLEKGEEKGCREHQDLSNVSATELGKDTTFVCMNCANVKVVTPTGKHGLSTEEGIPSSLLDRWRFGGGCDCGGWDMACPIVVFDKLCSKDDADYYSATRSQQQMFLFVQGQKDQIPALSILGAGKGQYSIDFHAQLSSLQAFSICIAILHSSEAAFALIGQEKNTQRLYSSSLKLLLEEEVRHLNEAVAEEEKRKAKKKSMEQTPPSFILKSPFSPIGRI